MTHTRFTPLIDQLPATVPFVGPETQERGRARAFAARLGANENGFGPSPRAIQAMQDAVTEVWKYADPTSYDLRHALAKHHAIPTDSIVVGEGIDGLLGYLVRLFVQMGDAVVTSDGAYPTFNYHVQGFGGTLHKVPYRNDAEDLPALLDRARQVDAKLVYFANPDNPMGTYARGVDIVAQLDRIPQGCLLVLDEAYVEFAPADAVPQIAIDDPRVIRLRTFSKAYGMAGARVGYAMGAPALIAQFEKIRNHFGMNRLSQIGAVAAVQDQDWLTQTVTQVAAARDRLMHIAQDNGLAGIPSATNFVTMDCGRDGAFAQRVLQGLIDRDVFVRMPFVAPQNRCIRVSVGTPHDLDVFAAALPAALAQARD